MEKVTSLNPEATPHCVWSSLCERPALPSACFVDHLQAQCQAQASRKDLSQLMVPVGCGDCHLSWVQCGTVQG